MPTIMIEMPAGVRAVTGAQEVTFRLDAGPGMAISVVASLLRRSSATVAATPASFPGILPRQFRARPIMGRS